MATLFLLIIYLTFISLGLPDSMLGAAWPVMQPGFRVPYDYAGLASMVVTGGTILASLLSGRLIDRFGTGLVTLTSVAMTAGALLGLSWAPTFLWVVVMAIPLGLGAGAVDSGINAYVAEHYKAHHMNWLHCFWGVGAMAGPLILSQAIARGHSWRTGYLIVGAIQAGLVAVLLLSLPLWGRTKTKVKAETDGEEGGAARARLGLFAPLHLPGAKLAMGTLLFYCGVESSVNLWGSSYLVHARGLEAATAAGWIAGFFGAITVGRFLVGFLSMKLSNKRLIRLGAVLVLAGSLLLMAPLPPAFALLAIVAIGLGCAPIFPGMLHETPVNFGKENAPQIVGFQMAAAYVGATLLPPLFGFIADRTSLALLPAFLLGYTLIMLYCSERLARRAP